MSGPPKLLSMAQVVAYVKEKHGLDVSRQTVYNWAKLGRGDETLEFIVCRSSPVNMYTHTRRTTEEKVDAFLRRCGIIGG
jgi:hypothetical protein